MVDARVNVGLRRRHLVDGHHGNDQRQRRRLSMSGMGMMSMMGMSRSETEAPSEPGTANPSATEPPTSASGSMSMMGMSGSMMGMSGSMMSGSMMMGMSSSDDVPTLAPTSPGTTTMPGSTASPTESGATPGPTVPGATSSPTETGVTPVPTVPGATPVPTAPGTTPVPTVPGTTATPTENTAFPETSSPTTAAAVAAAIARTGGLENLSLLNGETATDATTKALTIHTTLTLGFFDGKGREPTDDEVAALVEETEKFFTQAFQNDADFAGVFDSFVARDVQGQYDAATNPDEFVLEFLADIFVNSDATNTKEDAANVMAASDFKDYIGEFARQAEPVGFNEFLETHTVFFKGQGR